MAYPHPQRVHYDYARHEGLTRMLCSPFALEYKVFKNGTPLLSRVREDVTCRRCLRKMVALRHAITEESS